MYIYIYILVYIYIYWHSLLVFPIGIPYWRYGRAGRLRRREVHAHERIEGAVDGESEYHEPTCKKGSLAIQPTKGHHRGIGRAI